MTLNIYAIRDNQVDAFSQPFYSTTHGSALRAFADHVNEPGTPANKHPEDYQLYHLGEFDDATGELKPHKPAAIGTAREYHKKEQP